MKQPQTRKNWNAQAWAFVFSALIISSLSFGQKVDFSKMESMKPRSIGPAGMSGRITSIDVVRSQPNVIYAGSASGGVWKSESGGIAWTPIFDDQLALSIGAVAVSQKNPDVVWAGTGEGNPRNSLTGGYGIYRSQDAGRTWQLMGLEKTRNIHRIIIHPDDPNTVYVGAIGSPWGDHKERGVYKSTDGGETWNHILYVDEMTGVGDMVIDPSNPDKLFVNMWQHRREPWFFTSGGPSSGLYLSLDGGKNWTKQSAEKNGLPKGDLGKIGLAFGTNNPNKVYALVEAKDNALYSSDDGGFNWKMINDKSEIGNRPFYYFDIYVDPKNENRLYSIFTNVNVSEDAGKSFTQLIDRGSIHVDNHALYINPDDPKFMILGNDGGMAITRDMGKTWRFVQNLPLGQFYHIAVDNEVPYNVYGGLQDNGTWTGPAYSWTRGGIRNDYFHSVVGGDGFDVVTDPVDSRYGYSMSQQGNVNRYDKLTGQSQSVKPMHSDPDVKLRFNWNAAIAQNPFDDNSIYFGSQFVHKSLDKGSSWDVISPDLTTNDTTKQNQYKSGGLTIDATGAENHTTLLVIEPSPREEQVIWAGTDDGNVQITRDGGASWKNVAKNMKGVPAGSWVAQIKASRHNDGEAVAVINNYRRFDFKPYLYRTRNYGKSWEVLADESDVFGYSLSFVQDPVEPRLMFYGTENGLFISIDEGENWSQFKNGYPSVSTMDMVIQERESDLVIGTFGRAIYVLDDIKPLRLMANKGADVLNASLEVVPPSIAYMSSSRSASGLGNPGNSAFDGDNRQGGGSVVVKFFAKKPDTAANPSATNAGAQARPNAAPAGRGGGRAGRGGQGAGRGGRANGPQAKVEITDLAGNIVRNMDTPITGGLNQLTWRMDENPPEGTVQPPLPPGIPAQFARFFRNSGAPALPGVYNVKITIGDATATTQVEIQMDPRIEVSQDVLIARRDMLRTVTKMSAEVSVMSSKLTADIATVDKVLAALQGKRGRAVNELKTKSNETKEALQALTKIIGQGGRFGRGGNPNDPTPLTTRVSSLSRSISGSYDMPGRTQDMLMEQASALKVEVTAKYEAFYEASWDTYLEGVKSVDFSPIGTSGPRGN